VIAVSDSARNAFIGRQGVSPRKVEMVYNGVDFEEIKAVSEESKNRIRGKWMIPAEAKVLSVIARLSPEKGQNIFVLAAKEIIKDYPRCRFLIVGDGPERQNLEKLIDGTGLRENFVLTGFVKDIEEVLGITDIAVQPSYDAGESFGLTVAEAMSRGKPVLVSDIGCFREIVSDGQNGLFFKVGDHLSLASKARELLGNSSLRMSLGEEGRKTIKDRFDIRIMCRKTEQVYKNVLRQKGFMLYNEYIGQIEVQFLEHIKKDGALTSEKYLNLQSGLNKLLKFIYGQKRGAKEIKEYLSREYLLLIEKFLEFIEKHKPFLEPYSRYNLRLFKLHIRAIPVNSKDYDERVKLQSEQFQIDNYYEPKEPALKARVELILGFVNPRKGERILDLGCGIGTFAFHCAKQGAICRGVDYSQSSLEMAGKLVSKYGLEESVEFKCCDISDGLPFEDGYFDKIVSADFIEHLDQVQKIKFVSELRRLLKPKGVAVVFTPNLLREQLGEFKARMGGLMGGVVSETRLHFGLISRFNFEKMLRNEGFIFKRVFLDVERPYLARIPVLKEILSLNLLWVINKKE
jgi:2-polyprenyl-3-methyl-5-hydroxy-6-metoxy-1,4-benzoquinol methylase